MHISPFFGCPLVCVECTGVARCNHVKVTSLADHIRPDFYTRVKGLGTFAVRCMPLFSVVCGPWIYWIDSGTRGFNSSRSFTGDQSPIYPGKTSLQSLRLSLKNSLYILEFFPKGFSISIPSCPTEHVEIYCARPCRS